MTDNLILLTEETTHTSYQEPHHLLPSWNTFPPPPLDDVATDTVPDPSKLRISTMTATCVTNLKVSLPVISQYAPLVPHSTSTEGIVKTIFGKQIHGSSKKDKPKKNSAKFFYNQATIILQIEECEQPGQWKEVNLKLFNNGNIQITGLKSEADGHKTIHLLVDILRNVKGKIDLPQDTDSDEAEIPALSNVADFQMTNFQIVLINSDYSANFKIKRDVLHKLLLETYQIFSHYEPCIYPGVNSKYYWNEDYREYTSKGICHCTGNCTGKENGKGDGKCKRVTISVFQSGNVIITGARSIQQIRDAYDFINYVFQNHYDILKRDALPPPLDDTPSSSKNRTIILLPKQKIKYTKKKKIKIKSI